LGGFDRIGDLCQDLLRRGYGVGAGFRHEGFTGRQVGPPGDRLGAARRGLLGGLLLVLDQHAIAV
jgi:hypothetical protein